MPEVIANDASDADKSRKSKSSSSGHEDNQSGQRKKPQLTRTPTIDAKVHKHKKWELMQDVSENITHDEVLLCDYSCSLLRDIQVHGKLYLSQSWLSFYANVLGWVTVVTVRWEDITSITQKKNAKLIHEAIKVTTKDSKKYVFATFNNRDEAYTSLFRVWQNELLGQPTLPSDLKLAANKPRKENGRKINRQSNKKDDEEEEEGETDSDSCQQHGGMDGEDNDVLCPCHDDHKGKEYANEILNFDVDALYKHLFSQESDTMKSVFAQRNFSDISYTPYQEEEDGSHTQTLSYTIPVGLKQCNTVTKHVMPKENKSGSCHIVKVESITSGVPYGDTFYVSTQYCLTRVSGNRSRLRVTSDIVYTKSVFGLVKKMITNATHDGIKDYTNFLLTILKPESDSMSKKLSPSDGLSRSSLTRGTVRRKTKIDHAQKPDVGGSGVKVPSGKGFASMSMLCVLIIVICINVYIVHRVWNLEKSVINGKSDVIPGKSPSMDDEWKRLLYQQRSLHQREFVKLKEVVGSTALKLERMHQSITMLHASVEKTLNCVRQNRDKETEPVDGKIEL